MKRAIRLKKLWMTPAHREAIENIANVKETALLSWFGIESNGSKETETDNESESENDIEPECAGEGSTQHEIRQGECLLLDASFNVETSKHPEFSTPSDKDNPMVVEDSDDDIWSGDKVNKGFVEIDSDLSVSSEAEIWARGVNNPLNEAGKKLIQKRRDSIRLKSVRTVKKRLAEQSFLQRQRSKKVGTLVKEFPDIGKEIENYVKECGVGADAWRKTGVLTCDGNRKVEKKATFRKIKEHLEMKYNRRISYGTVVQFCVARNRRGSAVRYHGVVNVVSRRARKGFNVRLNPDEHWSSAFYKDLETLEYKDGGSLTNFGRDDQAGFGLDTMATHKLHATLCVKVFETTTTRTDYVNKYSSTI